MKVAIPSMQNQTTELEVFVEDTGEATKKNTAFREAPVRSATLCGGPCCRGPGSAAGGAGDTAVPGTPPRRGGNGARSAAGQTHETQNRSTPRKERLTWRGEHPASGLTSCPAPRGSSAYKRCLPHS